MFDLKQLQHLIYLTENHISFIKNTGDQSSIAEDESILKELKRKYQALEKRLRVEKMFDDSFKAEHYTTEDLGIPLTQNGYCKEAPDGCPYLKYIGYDGLYKPYWACRKYGKRINSNIFNLPQLLRECEEIVGGNYSPENLKDEE
jgi:hypothetical protein